ISGFNWEEMSSSELTTIELARLRTVQAAHPSGDAIHPGEPVANGPIGDGNDTLRSMPRANGQRKTPADPQEEHQRQGGPAQRCAGGIDRNGSGIDERDNFRAMSLHWNWTSQRGRGRAQPH